MPNNSKKQTTKFDKYARQHGIENTVIAVCQLYNEKLGDYDAIKEALRVSRRQLNRFIDTYCEEQCRLIPKRYQHNLTAGAAADPVIHDIRAMPTTPGAVPDADADTLRTGELT